MKFFGKLKLVLFVMVLLSGVSLFFSHNVLAVGYDSVNFSADGKTCDVITNADLKAKCVNYFKTATYNYNQNAATTPIFLYDQDTNEAKEIFLIDLDNPIGKGGNEVLKIEDCKNDLTCQECVNLGYSYKTLYDNSESICMKQTSDAISTEVVEKIPETLEAVEQKNEEQRVAQEKEMEAAVAAAEDADSKAGKVDLCKNISSTKGGANCTACMSGGDGVWTAIGCLPKNSTQLIGALIRFAMGFAGLALVAQIIIASGQIIFANGDSGKIVKARQRITNSIIAILFIIFSVTILQIIGVKILNLPGFFDGSGSSSSIVGTTGSGGSSSIDGGAGSSGGGGGGSR